MIITCPQCGFSRAVAENRLAGKSVVAICPKCASRFRFSAQKGVEEILPPKGWKRIEEPVSEEAPKSEVNSQEEEEDIRQVAAEAYRKEAERFANENGEENIASDDDGEYIEVNPWDTAPRDGGWFWSFCQVVLRVMFAAPKFFAGLYPHARQGRALAFYLVVCVFQTLVEKMWGGLLQNALVSSNTTDPQLQKVIELMASQSDLALNLIIRTGVLVFQLYVFSFLMFLVYRIVARERTTFSLVFQIMAYSAAPSLLCVVPAVGSIVGMFWGIACLAVGCKAALNLDWPRTLLGFLPLVFVFAPILLQTLALLQSAS